MSEEKCYFCGKKGVVKCGGCGQVWACCSAHLRLHYRGEEVGVDGLKQSCFPWKVVERPIVGRCMVAARKISAGEVMFQEEPIVIGPNQIGSPICLSCYASVSLDFRCAGCGYPMCGPACVDSPVHREECKVLSRATSPPQFTEDKETEAYHCILPLRMLLLSRSNPDVFSLADRLMDHEEERSQGSDWQITERTIVRFLLEDCKMAEMDKFTVEQVRRAVGILEVNSYEVHSFVSCGYRGCFPAASLISHGCVANTRHVWSTNPPYTNTCIATVDLEEGDEIITSYHIPTVCSLLRRPKLLAGWYFSCNCNRCASSDELGTNLNSVKCDACGEPSVTPITPLNIGSDWACCHCAFRLEEAVVLKRVTAISERIQALAKTDRYNIDSWLSLLDQTETEVHPQHATVIEICKWILPILCRCPQTTTEDYDITLVKRKLDLATRQRTVLDRIDPGIGKSRGKALYEEMETEIFLYVHDKDIVSSEEVEPLLDKWMANCRQILNIFDYLGCNQGFELVLCKATANILARCDRLKCSLHFSTLEHSVDMHHTTGNIKPDKRIHQVTDQSWAKFRHGWSLLQLWKWEP